MRDKVIAVSAVANAGVAVAVGLTIGALGGAFDDTSQTVQPPALRSDLSSAAVASVSAVITVPPSPTWQVAVPTQPRVTTQEPVSTTEAATSTEPSTTTRAPRNRATTEKPKDTDDTKDSEDSGDSETTTTR